jgi:choline dehydrogenase-like flavoprotein
MLWYRGNVADYTDWVQLGNPGWGWDDLLPYFKKVDQRQYHFQSRLIC